MRPNPPSSPPADPSRNRAANKRAGSVSIPAAIVPGFSSTNLLRFVDGLQSSQYFAQLSMKIAAHHIQDFDNQGVAHRVEDLIAGLAADEDVLGAQHGQMLRRVRLLDPQAAYQ